MSQVFNIGKSWPSYSRIKRLVIFGDSYSSVGYQTHKHTPDATNPLGVPFPGSNWSMWNEDDAPNWVGHLISKYWPEPRYKPKEDQTDEFKASPLLVYDFAVGGDTVQGVAAQVTQRFLPRQMDWTSDNSLFVTWVGINDCGYDTDVSRRHDQLFTLQEELYTAGARNFLFIDVPPIDRSPIYVFFEARKTAEVNKPSPHIAWNQSLATYVQKFVDSLPDVTAMVWSSADLFTDILDHPAHYQFPRSTELYVEGGPIWYDHIHPTTRVHDIIAKGFAEFLEDVQKGIDAGASPSAAAGDGKL